MWNRFLWVEIQEEPTTAYQILTTARDTHTHTERMILRMENVAIKCMDNLNQQWDERLNDQHASHHSNPHLKIHTSIQLKWTLNEKERNSREPIRKKEWKQNTQNTYAMNISVGIWFNGKSFNKIT